MHYQQIGIAFYSPIFIQNYVKTLLFMYFLTDCNVDVMIKYISIANRINYNKWIASPHAQNQPQHMNPAMPMEEIRSPKMFLQTTNASCTAHAFNVMTTVTLMLKLNTSYLTYIYILPVKRHYVVQTDSLQLLAELTSFKPAKCFTSQNENGEIFIVLQELVYTS